MPDELSHYGTPRHSGRYPWGSGGEDSSRNQTFLARVSELKQKGLSETQIASAFGMNTAQLRAQKSVARNAERAAQMSMAVRLRDKGLSNTAIADRMGLNESTVRGLLSDKQRDNVTVLTKTTDMLKRQVEEKGVIDIGSGVETHLGISSTKLSTATKKLMDEGYSVYYVKVPQLGTSNQTTLKVLAPPGMTYGEVWKNRDNIRQVTEFSQDGGRTYLGVQTPLSVSSKRLKVRYAEEGGTEADGVIYIRPGVKDLSLGGSRYAQVRIAVDGTHYLKGMAIYKDDLPDGVDLVFNTNKSRTDNKLDALKKMKDDPDNPFGATVRQLVDHNGKVTSAANIVNSEGSWGEWSKSLSSQMLSKQSPELAKAQLTKTYEKKMREYEEIMAVTNPTVRARLLQSFSDDVDAAAVHLKAAALPRQSTHVILPVEGLSANQIYAPNYRNGERVVLVRFPHGGIFEIPELVVNNRHAGAKKLLGQAVDAVGINAKVAERLSGADFDGDTVLVIPNNKGHVKTAPALAGLKNFDPKATYPAYEGMPRMTDRQKGIEMGNVSNLITDMTIRGATPDELARAVRHSMVVIDAEKHSLNYRQSAIDNGIAALKQKYQGGASKGASTIVSRSTADYRIAERKARSAAEGGAIDRKTGKKVYVETGAEYVNEAGVTVKKTTKTTKLAETDNAHTLSSGTEMEGIYADHSNSLKALANKARLSMLESGSIPYSPAAKAAHAQEVASLDAKLTSAMKNRPLERAAQVLANSTVRAKRDANPDMDNSELKKVKAQALAAARITTGASKQNINITAREWAAIQAGAISPHKLQQIIENADLDEIKRLATPKAALLMDSSKISRAQAMLRAGYTQADVADALGVSLTTLKDAMGGGSSE